MSATIDKRIVEMSFENSQFEKNTGESLRTIDRLKKALNFDGAASSFDKINSASGRVNLSGMADGIQSIQNKFSALGIFAITTLANIANSAYQAGARIVKSLTIDPIKTGLNEYETKLNSVQTILANTQKEGTNLEIVTNALNELNDYSDKTIYNFQQMARNIGTFTAAGVKLDTSVAAIKGIANLAAISGSNSDQASTAMYQLSQALSTGTVRLMDWNSVVNAGMGGQVFQDAIIETARLHGVAIDQIIKEEGSFRDSLQRGWFSSEILTETLQKFTGDLSREQLLTMGYTEDQIAGIIKMGQTANDAATKVKTFSQLFQTLSEAAQSGWAQTWELIIGDFEEAKGFLTDLNNWFGGIIGAAAESRNALLSGWDKLGGRTALIGSLQNVLNAIVSVINPIKQGFRDIFPATTAETLYKMSLSLQSFTKNLIIGGETAGKIRNIFKGVFAIFDIGKMAVVAIGKEFKRLVGFLAPVPNSIGGVLEKVSTFVQKLRDSIKANNTFEKVMRSIGDTILFVGGIIKKGIDSIITAVEKFKELNKTEGFLKSFSGALGAFFNFFKTLDFGFISDFMERLKVRFEPLSKFGEFLKNSFKKIAEVTKPIRQTILKVLIAIKDALKSVFLGILDALSNIDFSKFDFNKTFDTINSGLLGALLLSITQFVRKGSGVFGGILNIFKNVGNFAENASGILTSINTILNGVKDTFTAWQQQIKAGILLKIAGAIGILALSLLAISMIDSGKLTMALGAITGLFANLIGSLALYEKSAGATGIPTMASAVAAMIGLALSVLLLSGALVTLASIPTDGLIKGVSAITALSAILVTTSLILSKNGGAIMKGSFSMVVFGLALRTLIKPIQTLGEMDTDALTRALSGLGVLLLELGTFMRNMDFKGTALDDMLAIFILGAAISDLSNVIVTFGALDTSSMIQGLAVMGLIFGALVAFTKVSSGGLQFIYTAAGMLVLSGAMSVLADVLKKVSTMSWEELAIGLSALGGSLLILGVAMTAMSGGLAGAAGILVAAVALAILVPPLKALGKMKIEEVGIALLALAGVLTVFGLAGYLLTPVVPILLALGGTILIFGIAVLAAGVGVAAFAGGLALLATVGVAAGGALGAILLSVAAVLPLLAVGLALAIISFAKVIKEGAPVLFEAGRTLLLGFIGSVTETIPQIVDMILTGLDTLLLKLAEKLPSIVQSGYDILLAFLNGMSNNIGEIVTVVSALIANFMNALSEEIPQITQSGWNLIISWIDGMKQGVEDNLPTLMTSVQELGLAIIKGIIQGLLDGRQNAINAIKDIGNTLIESFKERLGIHSPSDVFIELARNIIQGLIDGIATYISKVRENAKYIVDTLLDGVKGGKDGMLNAGRDLVIGLSEGIKKFASEAIANAAKLAEEVLAAIKGVFQSKSPAKATFDIGGDVDQGLANGIGAFAGRVLTAVDGLGHDTLNGFTGVISKISEAVNNNLDATPTIRPVLDLSEIQNGSSRIDDIFGGKKLNMNLATLKAASVNTLNNASATDASASEQQTGNKPSVTFIQNNNSPKALRQIEIYRQTKNQLLQAKDLVGAQ